MFFFFIVQLLCSSIFPPALNTTCDFHLLFFLLYYVLPLHPLHCTMDLPFRLCTTSHPTHMHHSLRDDFVFSLFCMSFTRRVIYLIIMRNLNLLWSLFKVFWLMWKLSRELFSSLSVESIRLL
jgi:hypothetical protein